jgi:hypothetical protein
MFKFNYHFRLLIDVSHFHILLGTEVKAHEKIINLRFFYM